MLKINKQAKSMSLKLSSPPCMPESYLILFQHIQYMIAVSSLFAETEIKYSPGLLNLTDKDRIENQFCLRQKMTDNNHLL